MQVNDIISEGNALQEVEAIKYKSMERFRQEGFNLNMSHSNIPTYQNLSTNGTGEIALCKTTIWQ